MNKPSILEETQFSQFNLRDAYITDYAEYAAALRDEALFSNYGITVTVKRPKYENDVDEYSNFVDEDFIESAETVIPLFDTYRQNVSAEGMSADGTEGLYPLQIIIPTKLHLPKNSRLILNEYNSYEQKIAREWQVLSTEMKQLSNSKTYTRVANCVPARGIIQKTSSVDNFYGNWYFVINAIPKDESTGYYKIDYLRAYTTSYFIVPINFGINVVKRYEVHEEIINTTGEYNETIGNEQLISPIIDNFNEAILTGTDPITGLSTLMSNPKYININQTALTYFVPKASSISVLY